MLRNSGQLQHSYKLDNLMFLNQVTAGSKAPINFLPSIFNSLMPHYSLYHLWFRLEFSEKQNHFMQNRTTQWHSSKSVFGSGIKCCDHWLIRCLYSISAVTNGKPTAKMIHWNEGSFRKYSSILYFLAPSCSISAILPNESIKAIEKFRCKVVKMPNTRRTICNGIWFLRFDMQQRRL